MPKRDDRLLLEDIYEAGNKILEFTKNMTFNQYLEDAKTIDAVVRNFEVIGEASNLLTDHLKENYPAIKWRKMIGFRNILIHEYFGINHNLVWAIIHKMK